MGSSEASLAAAVVQNSLDGFAVLDRDRRYLLWNPAMERFTGKAAAEVLGRDAVSVFPWLHELGLDVAIARALRGEAVATDGVEHVAPDGARKVYDRSYLPLREPGGEIAGVIAIVRDVTERHVAQQALLASETKLRMASEAAGIGLWTWEPTADVITWDDTTCKLYGRSSGDAPRRRDDYLLLIHPDDRERSRERIARGAAEGQWEHEYRIVRPGDEVRWLASRTRSVRTERGELVLGAVFDVTERKQAYERQLVGQRVEVVSQLTAGIAHNFNNMLMGMLPNLQLAARAAPAELVPLLHDAEQSALRAAGVVRELMTYAGRGRALRRRVVAVGPLVERTVALCRTTFDRRIDFDVRCDPAATAEIDPSQLEQAVMNVLINARDALDDIELAAKLTVVCEPVSDPAELDRRPGSWVAIRVTDNGIGIDAATLPRIYEPFFTTKPAGTGTGLGLATTQAIVRNHGGFITCRSSSNRGTTFTLYVPAALSTVATAPSAAAPQRHVHATILLVDDDDQVRRATARMLASAGFAVETAATGEQALARVADASAARRIDLVLLDLSMPGMSGPETRRRLRELAPRLPIVFLTGYPLEPEPGDLVLQKPVTTDELVARLSEALRLTVRGDGDT